MNGTVSYDEKEVVPSDPIADKGRVPWTTHQMKRITVGRAE
jgi:hypothetical protein